MALINKLNDIGDAIRAKTGKEDKLTLEQMVTEIAAIETGGSEPAVIEALVVTENGTYTPSEGVDGFSPITVEVPTGGGDLPEEAFVVTGSCNSRFAYNGWNWFIENYGNQITTKEIDTFEYMFAYSMSLKNIPFELNARTGGYNHSMSYAFSQCGIETPPKVNNVNPSNTSNIFSNCYHLREIPSDWCDNWNWDFIDTSTTSYTGNRNYVFSNCYSLRSYPIDFLNHYNRKASNSYAAHYCGFQGCYVLDEIIDLPVGYTAAWTSNSFSYSFDKCYRLKKLIFALQEDGAPYTVNWKSQTIDLSKYVGYCNWTGNGSGVPSEDLTEAQKQTVSYYIINYNSGITIDKMVYNETSYQALKDDPDWYYVQPSSGDKEPYYSRYNHDSAVETINSLPDTSAYLASAGGTNTIKFKGAAGSKTDGGAIDTLTEEEIAVATAKGWTVTLV